MSSNVKTTRCPICASDSFVSRYHVDDCRNQNATEALFHGDRFEFIDCKCGHSFLNLRIKNEDIYRLYPVTYEANQKTGNNFVKQLKKISYSMRYNELRRHSSNLDEILEVGPGSADFAEYLKLKNVNITLADFTDEMTASLKNMGYTSINFDTLAKQPCEKFNAILAFQVLEHIKDVRSFVEICSKKLKRGGLVMFELPEQPNYLLKLTGKKWEGYHAPMHFHVFSATSLDALMNSHGFHRLTKKRLPGPFVFCSTVLKYTKNNKSGHAMTPLLTILSIFIETLIGCTGVNTGNARFVYKKV